MCHTSVVCLLVVFLVGALPAVVAAQFFRVRLSDQDDLIEQLLGNYEKLDADLRAELPLKRIWTVASGEAEES